MRMWMAGYDALYLYQHVCGDMVIHIRNSCLCLYSSEEYYFKEQNYNKSNTVRKLSEIENIELRRRNPKYIRINLVGSSQYFIRRLSDISYWQDLTIFSWRKDQN